jgi:creatinine amidohydrolase
MGLHLLVVDAILVQLKRAGFRAVFADGHGPSRWSWVENLSEREARLGLKLFGVTKEISREWKSQVDHAARNETSLMMHFRPDLVDLSQLPQARSTWPQGVGGEDPRDATASHGKECLEKSLELVRQMFAKAGLL